MTVEANMFVAVQALQLNMIDQDAFLAVCDAWSKDKEKPLSGILETQGRIDAAQRAQLERMLEEEQKLGRTRAALGQIADLKTRDTIRVLQDRDVQHTIAGLPPPAGIRIAPPEAPVTTTGRYTLTREYSEGGLSRIWLARDANLHRDVILKELHPGLADNEETRHRFMNEAQITGQLEHPNIVPVYELGPRRDKEAPFYTMRFVRGQTLQDAIQDYHANRDGPTAALDFRRLLGKFQSVCNAIAYAHSRGVLHRDLKPQNVVVGDFGEVILLDWGLAKLADDTEAAAEGVRLPDDHDPMMTAEGEVLGTPAYLAPELAMGSRGDVSERTDVYGLGGILYEILTGRPPHSGSSAMDVVHRVITEDTPRARDANAATPAALDAICAKAMAKQQDERYGSASELSEDVYRWMGDEPVRSYRERPLARFRRWTRRHRFATLAALMLLITLGVGFVNVWWQKQRAIEGEVQRLGRESLEESGRLGALIDILVDDAGYFADKAGVEGIFGPGGEAARTELANTFLEFLRHRPEYFQARLLDRDGNEVVRVERQRGKAPLRTTQLQNKKTAAYFRESVNLQGGGVYLSAVNLNRENNKITVPEIPVIRAAVPVFSGPSREGWGEADGIVVINTDFEPLFKMLEGEKKQGRKGRLAEMVCVTNREGYFLWNPAAPDKTFGFEPEKKLAGDPAARIQSLHPRLAVFYASDSTQDTVHCVSGEGEGRKVVFVSRLRLQPGQEDRSLGLAVMASYDAIEARAEDDYRVPRLVTFALMIALGAILVFAILLARRRDKEMRAGVVDPLLAADRSTGGRG